MKKKLLLLQKIIDQILFDELFYSWFYKYQRKEISCKEILGRMSSSYPLLS